VKRAHGVIHKTATAERGYHDFEETEVVIISSGWINGRMSGSQTFNIPMKEAERLFLQLHSIIGAGYPQRYITGIQQ
jgi:hypothetical protein